MAKGQPARRNQAQEAQSLLERMRSVCSNDVVFRLWINTKMDTLGGKTMLEAITAGDPEWVLMEIDLQLDHMIALGIKRGAAGKRDNYDNW